MCSHIFTLFSSPWVSKLLIIFNVLFMCLSSGDLFTFSVSLIHFFIFLCYPYSGTFLFYMISCTKMFADVSMIKTMMMGLNYIIIKITEETWQIQISQDFNLDSWWTNSFTGKFLKDFEKGSYMCDQESRSTKCCIKSMCCFTLYFQLISCW